MSTNNPDSADEIICPCTGTTRGQVEKLFYEGLDLDAISRRTGALSGCAGCEWELAELIRKLAEQQV